VTLDVTDPDSVAACAAGLTTLDVLVNNAGILRGGTLAEMRHRGLPTGDGPSTCSGRWLMTRGLHRGRWRAARGAVVNLASNVRADCRCRAPGVYSMEQGRGALLHAGGRVGVGAGAGSG